jgi:hypothetical protein
MSAEREYIRDGKVTKMIVVELCDYAEDLRKKISKTFVVEENNENWSLFLFY